ncbi:MAG: hypothetical protein JWO89_837 [Verrucomicrobiaceae bacterium]|nr:hypothetical protein [Verrucomicrobiaceae bacterium]
MDGLRGKDERRMAKTDLKALRELAWIGDSVLELYARSRVLKEHGGIDAEAKTRFTRNSFLNCMGNPTAVEARIGEIYHAEGLAAAHAWIAENFEPLYLKQEANRKRGR